MASNDVTQYIEKVVEDGVKTGLAGAGITGATTIATLTADPGTIAAGFISGFIISVVFSLISQPFGAKNSNHIFGHSTDYSGEISQIVEDIAASKNPPQE